MSFIPGRILSKLFNRTSLKNCGDKVCFSVKNRLAPATHEEANLGIGVPGNTNPGTDMAHALLGPGYLRMWKLTEVGGTERVLQGSHQGADVPLGGCKRTCPRLVRVQADIKILQKLAPAEILDMNHSAQPAGKTGKSIRVRAEPGIVSKSPYDLGLADGQVMVSHLRAGARAPRPVHYRSRPL